LDELFSVLDEPTAGRMRADLPLLWAESRCRIVFVSDHRVSNQIPRPCDVDEARLWEASLMAVRSLQEGDVHACSVQSRRGPQPCDILPGLKTEDAYCAHA
jgi:hypothetical protein